MPVIARNIYICADQPFYMPLTSRMSDKGDASGGGIVIQKVEGPEGDDMMQAIVEIDIDDNPIKFWFFLIEYKDGEEGEKVDFVAKTYTQSIGEILEKSTYWTPKSGKSIEKWNKSDWEENTFVYRTYTNMPYNADTFTKLIEEEEKEIKTVYKRSKKEIDIKIPKKIQDLLEKEHSRPDENLVYTIRFPSREKRNFSSYGPFLFANVLLEIQHENTLVQSSGPLPVNVASKYIQSIEDTVNGWRRSTTESSLIFPDSVALLALFLFSAENEQSIEPRIKAIVTDIKKRLEDEYTNSLIVVDKGTFSLTNTGNQLMLLLLGLCYLKHGKDEEKQSSLFNTVFGDSKITYRSDDQDTNQHIKAYELLCWTQENFFNKKVAEYKIPYAFVGTSYMLRRLTPQSLVFLSKTTINGKLECNACKDDEDVYYGSEYTTMRRKKRDDKGVTGNILGVCIKNYEALVREKNQNLTEEEIKRNPDWLNLVGSMEQMQRKLDKFKKDNENASVSNWVDYYTTVLKLTLDVQIRNMGNLRNYPEEKEDPKDKNWFVNFKATFASGADFFRKLTGMAAIYWSRFIELLLSMPWVYDLAIAYANQRFKEICQKLAIATLSSGDKNLVDMIKTEDPIGKRFNFGTGAWDDIPEEEIKQIVKKKKEKTDRLNSDIGKLTVGIVNMAFGKTSFQDWWEDNTAYIKGLLNIAVAAIKTLLSYLSVLTFGIGLFASAALGIINTVGNDALMGILKTYMLTLHRKTWTKIVQYNMNLDRAKRIYDTFLMYWNGYNGCLEDGKLQLVDGAFDEYWAPRYVEGFYNAMYMAPFYALNIINESHHTDVDEFILIEKLIMGQREPTEEKHPVYGKIDVYRQVYVGARERYQGYVNELMLRCKYPSLEIGRKFNPRLWLHDAWLTAKLFAFLASTFGLIAAGTGGGAIVKAKTLDFFWHGLQKHAEKVYDKLKDLTAKSIVIGKKAVPVVTRAYNKIINQGTEDEHIDVVQEALGYVFAGKNARYKALVEKVGIDKFMCYLGTYLFKKEVVTSAFGLLGFDTNAFKFSDWLGNIKDNYLVACLPLRDVLNHKDRNRNIFETRLRELIQRFKAKSELPSKDRLKDYTKFHNDMVDRMAIDVTDWSDEVCIFDLDKAMPFFETYRDIGQTSAKGWFGDYKGFSLKAPDRLKRKWRYLPYTGKIDRDEIDTSTLMGTAKYTFGSGTAKQQAERNAKVKEQQKKSKEIAEQRQKKGAKVHEENLKMAEKAVKTVASFFTGERKSPDQEREKKKAKEKLDRAAMKGWGNVFTRAPKPTKIPEETQQNVTKKPLDLSKFQTGKTTSKTTEQKATIKNIKSIKNIDTYEMDGDSIDLDEEDEKRKREKDADRDDVQILGEGNVLILEKEQNALKF